MANKRRLFVKHISALCAFVGAIGVITPAVADSGLSMPFSCQVNGGQVELRPSSPHTYRVYGTPESRNFSACSPNMPGGCPNLKLQRFDLDCGGVRVPWISVAEALSRQTRSPGYVRDGRFHMMQAPA